MFKKIAINGFGRIGRLTTRILLKRFPDLEIVAVNDLTSPENLGYLLANDSTYRKFEYPIKVENQKIIINNPGKTKSIQVFSQKDPLNIPWKDLGIDVVIESTGFFTDQEGANKHLISGAKKVIISAPAKSEEIPTVVLGVNKPDPTWSIISNASCTTNCITPALYVIQRSFGIQKSFGLTTHAYTATQVLQDGPTKKDFRDGRAGAINSIPGKTGAAKATFKVLPELKGKVDLSAVRIPVATGSMVYMTAQLEKPVSKEEFNLAFKNASKGELAGILEYSEDDLVSSDIIQNTHSTIFDSLLTEVLGDTVRFVIWYDNEWGYSNRLAELVNLI